MKISLSPRQTDAVALLDAAHLLDGRFFGKIRTAHLSRRIRHGDGKIGLARLGGALFDVGDRPADGNARNLLDEIGEIDRAGRLGAVDGFIVLDGKETGRGDVFRLGRRFLFDLPARLVDEAHFAEPRSAKTLGEFGAHGVQNAVSRHALALELADGDIKPSSPAVDLHDDVLGVDKRRHARETVFQDLGDRLAHGLLVRHRFHHAYIRRKPLRDILLRDPARVFHVLRRIGHVRHETKRDDVLFHFDLAQHDADKSRRAAQFLQIFFTLHPKSTLPAARKRRARHPPRECVRPHGLFA